MIGGALKLAGGVGKVGLGALGVASIPLSIPFALQSGSDLLEKLGYDPTGSIRRHRLPHQGAALEESLLGSLEPLEEQFAKSAHDMDTKGLQDLMELIQGSQDRLAKISTPVQRGFDPVQLAYKRGLIR